LTNASYLDELCGSIAGLTRLEHGYWAHLKQDETISYPAEGLNILADIEARSFWFNHRNAVISAIVRQYPPSGPIIDIGGGNGFVSQGLVQSGFDAIVIEPSPAGATVAKHRGLPVIRAAFQDLQVPDGSLDAGGMFDVLEHIEDDEGALRRVSRALKPGGLTYIAVPTYNFLWSYQDIYSGHYRRYTVSTLSATMRRAGLEPLRGTYFFSVLVPVIFLLRTIPSLMGLKAIDQVAKAEADHAAKKGAAGQVLKRIFDRELRTISAGRTAHFGSSCIVVGRKAR
jgi:SAM-dependent methyltransferase